MMNRKINIIKNTSLLLVLVLFTFTSCDKWLDVRPSNQFDEEEQFESEQGYMDVLIGTYQAMTDEAIYGAELSFRFLDVLAQLYTNKSTSTDFYGLSARYDYSKVQASQHTPKVVIENIWKKQYNAIAQLNYLLKRMDSKPKELSEDTYHLIKGEALALRAFLHFDLLRLFAPAFNEANKDQKGIPYVTDFTVSPNNALSIGDLVKKIEDDLFEAIDLQSDFQNIDQIASNQGSSSLELFYAFRQNRMNYWASKALLARVFLYTGDLENAKKYAVEVINSGEFEFLPLANRNFDQRDERSNITFTQEHIFSLYHSGLRDIADNYFKTSSVNPEGSDLYNTKTVLDGIFEVTRVGMDTDIRSTVSSPSRWEEHNNNVIYSKKYYSDNSSNVNLRMIPLIRLPEMYYIAAEASIDPSEALSYLNEVRQARGISSMLTIDQVQDRTSLKEELFKEYRKEYYAEGHLWYFFKRHEYTAIPNSVFFGAMDDAVYVFPIPDEELEFNPDFN